jgi:hypothetical protein
VTKIKRTTLVALLGAGLAAAGCGSDDEGEPIPAESASVLQSQLDNIEARIQNGSVGACDDILGGPRSPNLEPVEQAIADLPSDVDEDVRTGLEDGFNRLFQLVQERCDELRAEAERQQDTQTEAEPEPLPPETETVVPPETETTTTPPETETETETVPPPDTTEEEPTTPEEVPEEEEEAPSDGTGGVLAPEGDEG